MNDHLGESSKNTDVLIFIVDDSPVDRMLLTSTLEKRGHDVSSFTDGRQLLDSLEKAEKPVILLLDWMMPTFSGIDVCRKISRELTDVMVYTIMITARSKKEDVAFALDSGADDVVVKPYDATELSARVHAGMRFLRLRRQLFESNRRLQEHSKKVEALAEERAEQLLRADRLSTVGILSAGIAHEINNPTSFISVNIQTLEDNFETIRSAIDEHADSAEKESARELLTVMPEIFREMKDGIVRIHTIVNALKTYVHPHTDMFSRFNIINSIESALRLCNNRLKYGINIIKKYGDVPEITGDQYRLEQVFINLLTNAADAIEEKDSGGSIEISVAQDDVDAVVRIKDDGPGFLQENAETIFMPFYTTKDVGKGTGLGLSVCRNIIEAHRGRIEAKNHPEGGAEFIVRLPTVKDSSA